VAQLTLLSCKQDEGVQQLEHELEVLEMLTKKLEAKFKPKPSVLSGSGGMRDSVLIKPTFNATATNNSTSK
jgi:hypothetical protein